MKDKQEPAPSRPDAFCSLYMFQLPSSTEPSPPKNGDGVGRGSVPALLQPSARSPLLSLLAPLCSLTMLVALAQAFSAKDLGQGLKGEGSCVQNTLQEVSQGLVSMEIIVYLPLLYCQVGSFSFLQGTLIPIMPTNHSVWLPGHPRAWSGQTKALQAGTQHSTLITPAGTSGDKLHSFPGLLDSLLSHLFPLTMPPAFPSPSFLPSQQYRAPHTHIQNPPAIYFLYFRKYCGGGGAGRRR